MVDMKCKWCDQKITGNDYPEFKECYSCFRLRTKIESNLPLAYKIYNNLNSKRQFNVDEYYKEAT